MAGRPLRRARLAKLIHAHKAVIHKGRRKCKKCGRNHTLSEHWSHAHGTHIGAHGETVGFGRKPRPQGRRKRLVRKRRRTVGAVKTRRSTKRSPAQKAATARMLAGLARKRAHKAGRKSSAKSHRVKGHLAKTPGKRTKHRVAGHLAKNPSKRRKKGRKSGTKRRKGNKGRSPAQIAAFNKMIAARKAKTRGHRVRGHMAKNARRRGKHHVAAHIAHGPHGHVSLADDPTDIRGHYRPRLG